MKHIFLTLLAAICAMAIWAQPASYTDEDLSYRVTYKWGLIHQQAGEAEFILRKHDDCYTGYLVARTQPWADRIFRVRDTLSGTMRLSDMAPLTYVKATDEGRVYRKDNITYTYNHDNTITATCHRFKRNKKGHVETADTTLTAPAPGTDMLSVYYLVRRLPFDTMKPGTVAYAKIFSGKKIEDLAVRYEGKETVKLDGKKYECYKIGFSFSSERLQNTSAPMTAWISTAPDRIPIKLVGELTIGKIQVLYNASDKKKH